MKKYADLLGWFDRPEDEDLGVPSVVTRDDVHNARLYLQQHSGFDFERFEQGIQVKKLLNKPLGETPECLSAEDIAELVGPDEAAGAAVFGTGLAARAIRHIQHCEACLDNIDLYQKLKNRSVERAMEKHVVDLAPLLSIDSVGRLEPVSNSDPCLGLALTIYCDASEFSGMDTMHACILGPFGAGAKDVTLHRVEPWHKRWLGLDMTLISRRKSSVRPFKGYYRTDPLAGFHHVPNNTRGFVSIAQDVGGKGISSRGMIRCVVDAKLDLHRTA